MGFGVSAHSAVTTGGSRRPPSGEIWRCSTGTLASLCSRWTKVACATTATALAREGRDGDLVHPLVLDRLHRRGVGVRMRDLPVRVDSRSAQLGQRAPKPAFGLGMGQVAQVALRRDDQEARQAELGRSRILSISALPTTVSLATTSTLLIPSPSESSTTTCSTGTSYTGFLDPVDYVLAGQPDFWIGWVETMMSVGGGSSIPKASLTADSGSVSSTSPCAGMPASAQLRKRAIEAPPGGGAGACPRERHVRPRGRHRGENGDELHVLLLRLPLHGVDQPPVTVSLPRPRAGASPAPPRSRLGRRLAVAVQDRVLRARHAVLVRVPTTWEISSKLQRSEAAKRPATRACWPATGSLGARGPCAPAHDHVVDEDDERRRRGRTTRSR